MKIGLLHYAAPPVVGGVESVLAHQARLMADAGHEVYVIAARGEPWREDIRFRRGLLIDSRHPEVLAVKAELDHGQVTARFERLRDATCAEIRQLTVDLDVLIAHNVCSLAKNLALTAALHRLNELSGFPHLILWHHDLAWTTPRYRNELHAGYPWDLLRTDWPAVTQVVVSQLRRRELADLLQIPRERIQVVPNGVDLAAFFKLEALTADLIAHLALQDAAPLLLLPVRITRRKNLELAIRIVQALRGLMADAQLVITGPLGAHNPQNARYFEELQELRATCGQEDSVHFLAELSDVYLPDAVIADFYRLADALLLTSREEGFGIPLIEAALSRLPVFCTAIDPLPEIGEQDVTYFPAEPDPAAVACQIADQLNASARYRFAVRSRTEYTWPQVYARHLGPMLAKVAAPASPADRTDRSEVSA